MILNQLQHIYKNEVRESAKLLELPSRFFKKQPSAGFWKGQTDEQELGFSYDLADQLLVQLIDQGKSINEITLPGVNTDTIGRVIDSKQSQRFKQIVPYNLGA